MGLDMYLEVDAFVYGDNKAYASIVAAADLGVIAGDRQQLATVSITAAYWRKANAIHAWFVREVQDGQDKCQRSHVDASQLVDLLALTKRAISLYHAGDKEELLLLLPPVAGFFFGSTDIGEMYLDDLKSTEEMLTRITTAPSFDQYDYFYRASW